TGMKAPDRVEPQTIALRTMYMPLFRKHHVRLLVTGHDHLFDHFVERYSDGGKTYRLDCLVTGGGGAPKYGYVGEPDARADLGAGGRRDVSVGHPPMPAIAPQNQHLVVVMQVDGEKLALEVAGRGAPESKPYGGSHSKIDLLDRAS